MTENQDKFLLLMKGSTWPNGIVNYAANNWEIVNTLTAAKETRKQLMDNGWVNVTILRTTEIVEA